MAEDIHCDVVIAGAGPTGMTLALLLARRGVSVLVADREPDIYPLPRAAHIDHETVRIFQELGLAQEVMASCRAAERYDFLNSKGEVLLRFGGLERIGPGGWPAANMIHQPSIEATLRSRYRGAPATNAGVAVMRGARG
jgi:3-(3-hydroxy-phenyl)propionate hydroxylase